TNARRRREARLSDCSRRQPTRAMVRRGYPNPPPALTSAVKFKAGRGCRATPSPQLPQSRVEVPTILAHLTRGRDHGRPGRTCASGRGKRMNVAALRDSFERAADNDPELVHHFYKRLFAAHPNLRSHFPNDMREQEAALGAKLVEVLGHLEDPSYLETELPALGERHAVRYRVTPDMFGPVAESLVATLEAAAGGWGDRQEELRREWSG